jgi:glycosyltransferase involved in cell wall biosynthesis
MSDIALGVKVFRRTGKLSRLLDSVSTQPVDTVYIADDGELDSEKKAIYDRDYPFSVEVLDLEYDAGLGYGRARIVERFTEDYLVIVDSDHELVGDLDILRQQLGANERLGGVSGLLFERGQITATCHDLIERDDVLLRTVREPKQVELLAGHPFVSFDFVPNAAMFRRECLESYAWDEQYVIGKEHLDFYVGHKRETNWVFGVSPNVLFGHYPGGDATYTADRTNLEKHTQSKQYFMNKWGYEGIILGQTEWENPTNRSLSLRGSAGNVMRSIVVDLPPTLQKHLARARDYVRVRRGIPPV